MLKDRHQRLIDYLRISVTDRCNLRCRYCMPQEGVRPIPHNEILRYEELIRLARISLSLGIRKIRLTGGEPLVRRGIEFLTRQLASLPGINDLSMTTNGLFLAQYAESLHRAGLHRVNVSMDSLNPRRYRQITRGGDLDRVWEGIRTALKVGMHPVKINVVVMRGFNEDEVLDFAELSQEWPLQVRFIEWMPVGGKNSWSPKAFVPSDRILSLIRKRFSLRPLEEAIGNGPARIYRIEGGEGSVGVISPVSRHFCQHCNRLRLTPDGKLRTCLFSDQETDLKALLRSGAGDEEIRETIVRAIRDKPSEGPLHRNDPRLKKCARPMNRIGG